MNHHAMKTNPHATPSERVDYSAETHSLKEESNAESHCAVLAAESNAAHCELLASVPEAVVCSVPDCVRPAAAALRSGDAIPVEACFRRSDHRNSRGHCGLQASRWTWFRDRCLSCLPGTSATRCGLPACAMVKLAKLRRACCQSVEHGPGRSTAEKARCPCLQWHGLKAGQTCSIRRDHRACCLAHRFRRRHCRRRWEQQGCCASSLHSRRLRCEWDCPWGRSRHCSDHCRRRSAGSA